MIETTVMAPVKVTNISAAPWAGGRWRLEPGQTEEVPWDFFSSYQGAKALTFDLSAAAEHLAVEDREGRLTYDFWAPLSTIDGYGRHALAIMEALRGLGTAPILRDAGWSSTYSPGLYAQEAEQMARRPPCRIGLCMSVPYDSALTSHSSVVKIVITQFETNHVPAFHVKAVNKADHLILTSKFQPAVWKASGLRKSLPISVLNPGIDTDFFSYQRPEQDGKFKVLMLGALTGRKDPVAAVKIFQEASQGDPTWRLTLKTRHAAGLDLLMKALGLPFRYLPDSNPAEPDIQTPFEAASRLDGRIRLLISDDTSEGVRDWYQSHDALIWPSKGEGVGLPPLEAMSCGMEVVMSNNSGMADYAFPEVVWPIPTDHMEPADGQGGFSREYVKAFGSVGAWWVPDHRKGVMQLRRAFDAWRGGRGKGERAAAYVRSKHTLALQAQSVLSVIKKYAA